MNTNRGINSRVWGRMRLVVETTDGSYSILVNNSNFRTALQREMKKPGVVLIKMQELDKVKTLFIGRNNGRREKTNNR